MGESASDVIVLDHVSKRYGDFVAVHDANFSIATGEFFAMLGPSGCGKTTTLKMIAGFEQPTAGRVMLDGIDVSDVPPYKRNVNTVFQQYALFPHMSVFDNVAFGPRSKKVDESKIKTSVMEMLEIVRLNDFAQRKPSQLSGGQQQRVAIARSIAKRPTLLLGDELTGNLDTETSKAHRDRSLEPGTEIKFYVKEVINERKITLVQGSPAEKKVDPWEGISSRYTKKTEVVGKVKSTKDYGLFVEIEEGVVGLLHVSEFPDNIDIKDILKGADITVQVIRVEEDTRKVFLKL